MDLVRATTCTFGDTERPLIGLEEPFFKLKVREKKILIYLSLLIPCTPANFEEHLHHFDQEERRSQGQGHTWRTKDGRNVDKCLVICPGLPKSIKFFSFSVSFCFSILFPLFYQAIRASIRPPMVICYAVVGYVIFDGKGEDSYDHPCEHPFCHRSTNILCLFKYIYI